jgi:hypothetical protein
LDAGLFDRHVARLTELGYATARTKLVWPLGRMLLHRGDPDLTALDVDDLDELRAAIDAFTARLRLDPVREFYSRAPVERPPTETADGYLRSAIARLHAVHVLLFDLGQVDRPPTGRATAGSWVDRLAPPGAPPKIRAVIERYLRLHLDANLDRPQTVRHARDALRRLVTWMDQEHPEMASLADLHREHAEEFLRWLGTQTSQQTGAPLSISCRRSVVTLITRFVTETAAWGWDDVPARVLFSRADIPKIPKPLPRFIPDHELAKLMTAVEQSGRCRVPCPGGWRQAGGHLRSPSSAGVLIPTSSQTCSSKHVRAHGLAPAIAGMPTRSKRQARSWRSCSRRLLVASCRSISRGQPRAVASSMSCCSTARRVRSRGA